MLTSEQLNSLRRLRRTVVGLMTTKYQDELEAPPGIDIIRTALRATADVATEYAPYVTEEEFTLMAAAAWRDSMTK